MIIRQSTLLTLRWNSLNPEVRDLIERTLLPAQLEAWKLWHAGVSVRAIAAIQGRSRTTIKDRIHAANVRLEKAGLVQNSFGRYSIKEAA